MQRGCFGGVADRNRRSDGGHWTNRKTEEMGVSRLFLEVRESNERAIHVYEKAGFVKNGLRKNYYEDPVEHAVLMMHETTGKER